MSETIERVAKAIDAAVARWQPGESLSIKQMAARAAIEALRDPDNSILKAGCVALDKPDAQAAIMGATLHPNGSRRIEVARVKMRTRWNAMLDAALAVPSDQCGGGK